MNRISALLAGFWLFGASVGAALTGVPWTFWAFSGMMWFGLIRMVWYRRPRNGNGGPAHA